MKLSKFPMSAGTQQKEVPRQYELPQSQPQQKIPERTRNREFFFRLGTTPSTI
jgi:hypothetical protein